MEEEEEEEEDEEAEEETEAAAATAEEAFGLVLRLKVFRNKLLRISLGELPKVEVEAEEILK